MKQMKKLQAAALCLILCLALLPLTVFADDGGLPYDIRDNIDWTSTGGKIFRLQDGRDVTSGFSYTIPEGGVTMLIFFSTTCGNCQADFSALSDEEWIRDPRLNILALETNGAARDDVQAFMDSLVGGAQTYFHTFYGPGCQYVMWNYFGRTINGDSLTWPFIVLVRSSCGVRTIRSATMGYQYVSDIRDAVNALYAESEEESGTWSVVWEWSEDCDSARAVFTSDSGEQRSADAQVVKHTVPATTERPGSVTAEAAVVFECRTYRDTRVTEIPMLPFRFTDVSDPGDYFYAPVYWAKENGITSGTTATTFSPGKPCTRGQIVTFLWKLMGSPEPVSLNNPFADVSPSDYFFKAVLWAKENGITSGTTATTFSPGKPCTRGQCMTFLWHAAGDPPAGSTANPFTDVKAGDYFRSAVLWAKENSITSGTTATTFSPGNTCTRGQIVTFLYKYAKLTGRA